MASPTTDRRLGLVGNTAFKAPALLATTGNIVLSGEQVIDGTLTASSRVLVKNQTDTTQNGLYDTSTGTWTRCIDANGNQDLARGTLVLVSDGTASAGLVYQLVATTPITVGTTAQTWQLSLTASVSTLSFTQTGAGAAVRSALAKMRDVRTFADYGADPTGATSSAAAIQAAFTAGTHVVAGEGTFLVDSSVTISAGTTLDLSGANIVANTGANPLFKFLNGSAGLTVHGGGGIISGTCSDAFYFEGTTNTPTLQAHYASIINMYGVQVSSATITRAMKFSKAVKSVNLYGCNFFTVNGIDSNAKGVEINLTDCIVYGATGAAGTRGIKLRAAGGTTYYNEGWNFKGCTIDNFEIAHDVTDIFDYQVCGGHMGNSAGGFTFSFQAPSTNLCQNIFVGGGVTLSGPVQFVASGGGIAYHAKFDGFQMLGVTGTHIAIGNNAAQISVRNFKFLGSTNGNGVVGATNNNPGIVVEGGEMDSTFISGVQLKGGSGAGCRVSNITYAGTGDVIYYERPVYTKGVPVTSANVAAIKRATQAGDIAGNYALGATIASIPNQNFVAGETGVVDVQLSCSAMSTNNRLDVSLPAGLVEQSWTSGNQKNIQVMAANGIFSRRVYYYANADVALGTVSVTNSTLGSSMTVASHSHVAINRDW